MDKTLLVTLNLLHLFNIKKVKVFNKLLLSPFIFFCFFLNHFVNAGEIVFEERLVFKIQNTVYALSDLKQLHLKLSKLSCLYENSLIISSYRLNLSNQALAYYRNFQTPFSKDEILQFVEMQNIYKLLEYSETHNIEISQNLLKSLRELELTGECSDNDDLAIKNGIIEVTGQVFLKLLKSEIFLRSRYLKDKEENSFQKAIESVGILKKSLQKQYNDEAFF